jgi:hypothetical protein
MRNMSVNWEYICGILPKGAVITYPHNPDKSKEERWGIGDYYQLRIWSKGEGGFFVKDGQVIARNESAILICASCPHDGYHPRTRPDVSFDDWNRKEVEPTDDSEGYTIWSRS